MSRSRRAASGLVSGYLMVAVTLVVQLLMVPLATSVLGDGEVGLWGLTQRMAYLFTLLDLGLLPSVSRLLVDHKEEPEGIAYRRTLSAGTVATLMMCAITGVATLAVASPLAGSIRMAGELRSEAVFLLMATGFTIALSGVFRVPMAMLYAWQRHDLVNYAQALGQLANLGVFWLALRSGNGVRSAWYGQATLAVVIGLSTLLALGSMGRLRDLGRLVWPGWSAIRMVLRFGLDLFWVSLGTQMALNTQGLVLGWVHGVEATGVWEVATRPFVAVSQLVWKVLDSAAPGLSEMISRGERRGLEHRFGQVVTVTTLFAGVAWIGLGSLTGTLVRNWGGVTAPWPWWNDFLLGGWLFLISIYRCHCTLPILQKSIAGMRWVYLAEGVISMGCSYLFCRYWGDTALPLVALVTATLTSGAYGFWRSRGTFGCRWQALLSWSRVAIPVLALGALVGPALALVRIEPWWVDFGLKAGFIGATCAGVGLRFGVEPALRLELLQRFPGRVRRMAGWMLGVR